MPELGHTFTTCYGYVTCARCSDVGQHSNSCNTDERWEKSKEEDRAFFLSLVQTGSLKKKLFRLKLRETIHTLNLAKLFKPEPHVKEFHILFTDIIFKIRKSNRQSTSIILNSC